MSDLMKDKPKLLWIEEADLFLDHSYQRSAEKGASRSLIGRIAVGFDWAKFQALTVCERRDARGYNVVDGQHRLLAARQRGDLPKLPCLVVAASSTKEEAEHFIALNKDRIRIHTIDMFHAKLAAGDERAALVTQVCKEAGVMVCKTATSSQQTQPDQLQCVGTLELGVERYSKNAVVRALKTVYKAFPDTNGQMRASIIMALFQLYSENLKAGKKIDDARLSKLLGFTTARRLEGSAKLDEKFTGGTAAWIAAYLAGEYNKGLPAEQRLGTSFMKKVS